MSATYTTLVGAPPLATDKDWLPWYRKLLNARVAYSDVPRLNTYFFSQSGNDSDAGTILAPYQTIAKAQALHNSLGGDVMLLFKRGDEWNETTGLTISNPRCTVGSYGIGDKPLFNRFVNKYNSAGWTLASGNRYTRAETLDIAWVRDQDDRLNAYTKVGSSGSVTTTPRSFFWGSNVLHINSGVGINPNNLNLESVDSNDTSDGVSGSGDGGLGRNIRCDGWGCHRTSTNPQIHPYVSRTSGTDSFVFMDMEGYYSGGHIATHYGATSGGFDTFINCKAGYTKVNASGETVYNTYATGGGQETIWHNCEVTYGTLPSDEWVTATVTKRGIGVYGHTGGGSNYVSLVIVYGMTYKANKWGIETGHNGIADMAVPATLADVRSFISNEVFEENNLAGLGFSIAPAWTVRMNGAYYLKPANTAGAALTTNTQGGWAINNYIQVDFANVTENPFALFNGTGAVTPAIWNNHIHYKNFTGLTVGGDYDTLFGGPGYVSDISLKNNIFSSDSSGTAAYVGLYNNSTQTNNAYYGMTQDNGAGRGYNLHSNKIALSAQPAALRSAYFNTQLYHAGTDLSMDYDSKWSPRTSTPSIGPIDELPYPAGVNFHTNLPVIEDSEETHTMSGTNTQVLFFDGNDNPAGDAGMTYNKTTNVLKTNSGYFTSIVGAEAMDFAGNVIRYTNTNADPYTQAITPSIDGWTVDQPWIVPDEAYGSAWNGSLEVPTKNAVYDKIQNVGSDVLFDHFADVGNIGTGEDDLYSDTLIAGQLANNGEKIEAQYGGLFVSSGTASRRIRIYFGGTLIFDTGALTLSLSAAWTAYVTIIRVSSSVVRTMISLTTEGAALAAYTSYLEVTGLTLTNTQVLKITGEAAGVGAATGDIVAKMGYLEWKPQA